MDFVFSITRDEIFLRFSNVGKFSFDSMELTLLVSIAVII